MATNDQSSAPDESQPAAVLCPDCGAPLRFDADKQGAVCWVCETGCKRVWRSGGRDASGWLILV